MAVTTTRTPPWTAGLLMYRRRGNGLQVLLAHPGGPFWAKRDLGAWSLPKGQPEPGEDELTTACREFEEETGVKPRAPFLPLGSVRQKAGKTVHAWAWEGDADAAAMRCNEMDMEWPPGSGRVIRFPEVDRCEWFDPDPAGRKLNPAQKAFIDRLRGLLSA